MIEEFQKQGVASDACPSPHSLIQWLADREQLSQAQLRHVNHCGSCQRFLDQSSDDKTLQRLALSTSSPAGTIRFADEPELKDLLSKLRQPSATAAVTIQQTSGQTEDEAEPL